MEEELRILCLSFHMQGLSRALNLRMADDPMNILNRYHLNAWQLQFECYFLFCCRMLTNFCVGYTDWSCTMIVTLERQDVGCGHCGLYSFDSHGGTEVNHSQRSHGIQSLTKIWTRLLLKYDILPLCQAAGFGYVLYPMEELIISVIAYIYVMEVFSWYFSQDILVFLTGQEEIEAMARSIRLIMKVRPAARYIWSQFSDDDTALNMILIHLNPVCMLTAYFWNIQINVISLLPFQSPRWLLWDLLTKLCISVQSIVLLPYSKNIVRDVLNIRVFVFIRPISTFLFVLTEMLCEDSMSS
jgi:hypothetical protein